MLLLRESDKKYQLRKPDKRIVCGFWKASALTPTLQGLTCTLFLALNGPFGGGKRRSRVHSQPPILKQSEKHPTAIGVEQTWWVETVSTAPRIFRIHNLLTDAECDHRKFRLYADPP